jgi:hypothetical protein
LMFWKLNWALAPFSASAQRNVRMYFMIWRS